MKRISSLCSLCIMLLLLSAGVLQAREGLSVSFGAAYNADGANMGEFIERQGVDSNGDSSFAKSCLLNVIVPFRALKKWETTDHPSSSLDRAIFDLESDGAMKGLNLSAFLRYDFMHRFFIRTGLEYDFAIMGGESRWTFYDMTGLDAPTGGNGPVYGTKGSQVYSYEYFAVPITIGINIPIRTRGRIEYNVYGGIGISYYNGGWSLEMDMPMNYIIGYPEEIHERLEFKRDGFGLNWVLGADVMVFKDFFFFIEFNGLYIEKKYASSEVQSGAMKDAIFGTWGSDTKLELPVDFSYTLIRVGFTYKLI